MTWLRRLLPPYNPPFLVGQVAALTHLVGQYESRLHALEVENRDLTARLALVESEHRQLLAPPPGAAADG